MGGGGWPFFTHTILSISFSSHSFRGFTGNYSLISPHPKQLYDRTLYYTVIRRIFLPLIPPNRSFERDRFTYFNLLRCPSITPRRSAYTLQTHTRAFSEFFPILISIFIYFWNSKCSSSETRVSRPL